MLRLVSLAIFVGLPCESLRLAQYDVATQGTANKVDGSQGTVDPEGLAHLSTWAEYKGADNGPWLQHWLRKNFPVQDPLANTEITHTVRRFQGPFLQLGTDASYLLEASNVTYRKSMMTENTDDELKNFAFGTDEGWSAMYTLQKKLFDILENQLEHSVQYTELEWCPHLDPSKVATADNSRISNMLNSHMEAIFSKYIYFLCEENLFDFGFERKFGVMSCKMEDADGVMQAIPQKTTRHKKLGFAVRFNFQFCMDFENNMKIAAEFHRLHAVFWKSLDPALTHASADPAITHVSAHSLNADTLQDWHAWAYLIRGMAVSSIDSYTTDQLNNMTETFNKDDNLRTFKMTAHLCSHYNSEANASNHCGDPQTFLEVLQAHPRLFSAVDISHFAMENPTFVQQIRNLAGGLEDPVQFFAESHIALLNSPTHLAWQSFGYVSTGRFLGHTAVDVGAQDVAKMMGSGIKAVITSDYEGYHSVTVKDEFYKLQESWMNMHHAYTLHSSTYIRKMLIRLHANAINTAAFSHIEMTFALQQVVARESGSSGTVIDLNWILHIQKM